VYFDECIFNRNECSPRHPNRNLAEMEADLDSHHDFNISIYLPAPNGRKYAFPANYSSVVLILSQLTGQVCSCDIAHIRRPLQ
jgi:hypothetical protein